MLLHCVVWVKSEVILFELINFNLFSVGGGMSFTKKSLPSIESEVYNLWCFDSDKSESQQLQETSFKYLIVKSWVSVGSNKVVKKDIYRRETDTSLWNEVSFER